MQTRPDPRHFSSAPKNHSYVSLHFLGYQASCFWCGILLHVLTISLLFYPKQMVLPGHHFAFFLVSIYLGP